MLPCWLVTMFSIIFVAIHVSLPDVTHDAKFTCCEPPEGIDPSFDSYQEPVMPLYYGGIVVTMLPS